MEDGVNGYIVEEKNSQDLIAKIELFLDESVNEHMEMGIAGRKKVEKELNKIQSIDISISHIKDTAVASVSILI